MIKKLQALARWSDYFFTIWLNYGFANCFSFFKNLFSQKAIRLHLPTGALLYSRESKGATIYHTIHSPPKLRKIIESLPEKNTR